MGHASHPPSSLDFWESGPGAELIAEIDRFLLAGGDVAAAVLTLQKRGVASGEVIREAAEFAKARSRAVRKFGRAAGRGLFTVVGVEQASRPEVAKHHARRFQGCRRVLEIGCGLGTDSLALAGTISEVVSVEADARTAQLAQHRFRSAGVRNIQVVVGRIESLLADGALGEFDGVFADPARRSEERGRVRRSDEYSPALPWLVEEVASMVDGPIGIKVAPGLPHEECPEGWAFEMLGFRDECLEQTWWFNTDVVSGSACLVDVDECWCPARSPVNETVWSGEVPPGMHLIEPHPALIRTGCLSEFYADRDVSLLESETAYGLSAKPLGSSPWYSCFEVIELLPYSLKRLERTIAELAWSEVEVKKRGVALDVERIAATLRRVRRAGGEKGVVLLSRRAGKPVAVLAKRVQ